MIWTSYTTSLSAFKLEHYLLLSERLAHWLFLNHLFAFPFWSLNFLVSINHESQFLYSKSLSLSLSPSLSLSLYMCVCMCVYVKAIFSSTHLFTILAMLHSLWDLSSPTRDWTQALASKLLDCQGIPHLCMSLFAWDGVGERWERERSGRGRKKGRAGKESFLFVLFL